MYLNFESILTGVTIATGVLWLLDKAVLAPRRNKKSQGENGGALFLDKVTAQPKWLEYTASFFPVLILVLILRSFVFELFRVPTGSLEPTVRIGDLIYVNKYAYGLRLPVLRSKILATGEPKRGDIGVFLFPPNPKIYYVKRIVGVPGDRISYLNRVLYINGKPAPQTFQRDVINPSNFCSGKLMHEKIDGKAHAMYLCPDRKSADMYRVIVPEGHYFAMGDNRDDSGDSRSWGFVPEANLVGRAERVGFSWAGIDSLTPTGLKNAVRWNRTGRKLGLGKETL